MAKRIKYQNRQTETRREHDGTHHLVDAKEEYTERVSRVFEEACKERKVPESVAKEIEKFRDKPAFQYSESEMSPELQEKIKRSMLAFTIYLQNLERKIRDGYARRETVKQLKEANTPEEKRQILEEFHREGSITRKQTALKLDCMKEIQEIRKRNAMQQLLAKSSCPAKASEKSTSKSRERVASGIRSRRTKAGKGDR